MIWNRVKISDCVSKVSTVNPSSVYNENLFKYVDIASIDNKTKTIGEVQYITGNSAPSRARQVLEEGDILVSTVRPNLNAVALVTNELNGAIGSTGFCVLRPINNTLHPKYLFYWVRSRSFISEMEKKATGASYPAVSDSIIKNSEIPLPPLPIQQQIADTLDKADALRRKDQELLDKYDELAQAVFYEMFGDPVRNEKKWQKEQLKSVCIQITDGTHFSPPTVSDGVPYITAKHVKNTGIYFYENPSFISKLDHEEIYSRCSPKKGDILYIKDGATTGVATINEFDFEFSMLSSLALIKPDSSKLNNQYLKHWLNHPLVKENYIREYMAGAAIKRFTLAKIKSFSIYVPPISLQNMFCKTIEKIERANKRTTESLKKSTELFNSALFRAFKS